jgi:hypothetical protein
MEGVMNSSEQTSGSTSGRVLVGMLIIVVGLVLMADRIGLSGIHLSGRSWPLFLIAFGIVRLIAPADRGGRPGSRRGGAWFMYLGLWFFVNEFHLFGFDYHNSWPLLVVGAGIGMVWRAFEGPAGGCTRVRES